jgi:hypothetical protein
MSTFDELDKTFNIAPIEEEVTEIEVISSDESSLSIDKTSNLNADYEHSRKQIYDLIQTGQNAIKGIMDVASQTDHPRAYEVAFQGIKNVSELADKLVDLQKKMKTIEEDTPSRKGPSTVNNTMFIGSTAELQKFLKQSKINNTEE